MLNPIRPFPALLAAALLLGTAAAATEVRVLIKSAPRLTIVTDSTVVTFTAKSSLPAVFTPGESHLRVDGRPYRGSIIVERSGRRLNALNELALEDYLRGVVPAEMPKQWPLESLKAQAVAARTYALYVAGRNGDRAAHDLVATTSDQVYLGVRVESEATNAAIDATAGEVLEIGGRPICAYFHSHCGGMTANATDVFGARRAAGRGDAALLCRPDTFCAGSPHDHWRLQLDAKSLNRLGRALAGLKRVTGIAVLDRDSSGRVARFVLSGKSGNAVVSGVRLRMHLGPNRLRSLLCDVTMEKGIAVFTGSGWGHGVGLCQWGARGRAEAGENYRRILEWYYPGAVLSGGAVIEYPTPVPASPTAYPLPTTTMSDTHEFRLPLPF